MRRRSPKAGVRQVGIAEKWGEKIPILLVIQHSTFQVVLDGDRKTYNTYGEAYDNAIAFIEDKSQIDYVPVIFVTPSSGWNSDDGKPTDDHLDLRYKRLFRGIKKDGEKLYREFLVDGQEDDEGTMDRFDGTVGGHTHFYPDDDEIEIPYTEQNWVGLRRISAGVRELNRKIRELVTSKDLQKRLANIAARGGFLTFHDKERHDGG